MSKQIWETRPLEIWGKAKELRANFQKAINEAAASPNSLLAHGNTGGVDWSVGFDGLNVVEDNPIGAIMASRSDSFSREARLASEIRGWGRELCGYVNNCWGCQFLGYDSPDGAPFPYRQLSVPLPDPCDQHAKRGQQCMDLSPIPRFGADWPMYLGPIDPERESALVEHKVQCILHVINEIERIFGKKYDDEKLFNVLDIVPRVQVLVTKIAQLMANVPAPLGLKELYSFYTLSVLTKIDPQEMLDFWKAFVDEVQWRVDNKIAAVATERYRWMEAHPSPWHFLRYFRYMEQYGAVCIGSQYSHMLVEPFKLNDDGTIGREEQVKVPEGQKIRTREDALRSIFREARGERFKDDEYFRKHVITDFAKAFHVDGAIMPLWRAGVGCTLTRKEQGLRLSEMGVRVLHYEGAQPGDRTDLDEHDFLDRLDIWMESQGLEKLA
ncbi:MAG: 2-hydroxyacyl-CoA dehydratase [Clostridiales Family XIII bacterium]|jgi:benzoyl-CoA reductase subunit B|nr:2-hydroxyacyl-CoA dehydratase [Clostridiales Family XIII bacterium]